VPRAIVIDWAGNAFPFTVALDKFGDPPRKVNVGGYKAERDVSAEMLTYRAFCPPPRKGAK